MLSDIGNCCRGTAGRYQAASAEASQGTRIENNHGVPSKAKQGVAEEKSASEFSSKTACTTNWKDRSDGRQRKGGVHHFCKTFKGNQIRSMGMISSTGAKNQEQTSGWPQAELEKEHEEERVVLTSVPVLAVLAATLVVGSSFLGP